MIGGTNVWGRCCGDEIVYTEEDSFNDFSGQKVAAQMVPKVMVIQVVPKVVLFTQVAVAAQVVPAVMVR